MNYKLNVRLFGHWSLS